LGRCLGSPDLRYLKQIKSRSARIEFDGRNVPVFELEKFDLAAAMGIVPCERPPIDNFLGYRFSAFGDEKELCGRGSFSVLSTLADRRSRARSLARRGTSVVAIAAELGVSLATAQVRRAP
jgi:hypothetical protein